MKISVATVACAAVLVLMAPVSAQPQDLGTDGPGSTIGVSVAELKTDQAANARVESGGVFVERVQEGTPAAQAGFKQGDVVVEFDGERVRSTRQFVRLVRETPPNRAVKAIVVRDGSRQTLTVTPELGRAVFEPSSDIRALANRQFRFSVPSPSTDSNNWGSAWIRPARGRLGMSITAVGDQLASYFGVKQGVLVESVEVDSAASRAGLKAGDVIIEANGRAVEQPAQLTDVISATQPGASVDLKIVREKKELILKATLPDAGLQRLRKPSIIGGAGVI